jgi:hypothetical protein
MATSEAKYLAQFCGTPHIVRLVDSLLSPARSGGSEALLLLQLATVRYLGLNELGGPVLLRLLLNTPAFP